MNGRRPRWCATGFLLTGFALFAAGCGRSADCIRCGILQIATASEPDGLLPPLIGESVGRDITDQLYERLANLKGGASPLDSSALAPGLAQRWERVDSLTLRFHLRPGARWHDGSPATAGDVVFSFGAYADSGLDAQARPAVSGITATAVDDSTVLVHFARPDAEQWYDATWHVRILPRHVWDSIPRARWADIPPEAHVVGSGPYRLTSWIKGQSLTLEATDSGSPPGIRKIIWRFGVDQDAALNLFLSHEADLVESIGDSARVARVAADSGLATIPYPSAIYGFLGFNLEAPGVSPVKNREVRQALTAATDRQTTARAAMGPGAVAPPGPMSRILWINDGSMPEQRFDSAAAALALDQAGWIRGGDGVRRRGGLPLTIDILVPGSSASRKNLAQILQEMWRRAGVQTTVTIVDFPVFQERLRKGKFESFIGAWLDEPSPRSLADQWTSAGVGVLNYTRYRSAAFDSLFGAASTSAGSVTAARAAWRAAMSQLNLDAPGIWLYTPMNVAGVARRVEGVTIDPYSWLAGLRAWKVTDVR